MLGARVITIGENNGGRRFGIFSLGDYPPSQCNDLFGTFIAIAIEIVNIVLFAGGHVDKHGNPMRPIFVVGVGVEYETYPIFPPFQAIVDIEFTNLVPNTSGSRIIRRIEINGRGTEEFEIGVFAFVPFHDTGDIGAGEPFVGFLFPRCGGAGRKCIVEEFLIINSRGETLTQPARFAVARSFGPLSQFFPNRSPVS